MELSNWLVDHLRVVGVSINRLWELFVNHFVDCLWGICKSSVGSIYKLSVNCLWGCDRPPFMRITNLPSPCSSSPLKLI